MQALIWHVAKIAPDGGAYPGGDLGGYAAADKAKTERKGAVTFFALFCEFLGDIPTGWLSLLVPATPGALATVAVVFHPVDSLGAVAEWRYTGLVVGLVDGFCCHNSVIIFPAMSPILMVVSVAFWRR